ncbi:hypothetical protein Pcinc_021217 [Petrolisthes cinctipes]|uniref:CCHC-type domain-containing protein n=1 Tax=Petrolisthes cinctipes TaxID=88211 RepID=A0AAE1FGE1_PETCI|nr:hypothetical protein Pcinc_021217 [Petrolisthes cinctipes]
MMELAERFVTAHGGLLNNSRTHSETRSDKQNTQKEGKSHQSGSDTWNKPEKGEHRKMVCFRCDRPGHKAFQCKERKKQAQVSVCKEVGAQKPEPSETVEPDECVHNEALPCGHVVEVVTAIACMPVVRGTVCGAEVTILRDTGCSTIVVRKSLVPASKFTGRNCSVRLANCVVERYPLAQVHIECPYFTGTVNAVCMEEPIYDVLIGNVPGALPLQEMYSTPEAGVSAVATRAAAQKPLLSRKKLKVPDFEAITSVDRKAFQEAQQVDTSLKTCRPAVSCADVTAAVVEEEEEEPEQLPLPSLYHKETWRQVKIGETLTGEQQNEIRSVLEEYNEVWSDVPGRTSLLEHKITLIQEQVDCIGFHTVTADIINEMDDRRDRRGSGQGPGSSLAESLKNPFHFERNTAVVPLNQPKITRTTADSPPRNQSVEDAMEAKDVEDEDSALNSILSSNSATSRTAGRNNNMRESREDNGQLSYQVPSPEENWSSETHLMKLPTNAYGTITFINETTGSCKSAKYIRLTSDTEMSDILTLFSKYWHLQDSHRPQLAISVKGGTKNFHLDGKKKDTFTMGLIKDILKSKLHFVLPNY